MTAQTEQEEFEFRLRLEREQEAAKSAAPAAQAAKRMPGGLNPARAAEYANESFGQSLKRQVGELLPSGADVGAAVKGATALPHMLVDPFTNLARTLGVESRHTPNTAAEESAMLDQTLGAPTTPAGRIKGDVIQSLAGVPMFTAGGKALETAANAPAWAKAVGSALAADPAKQAASAVLAGAGSGGAREAGGGQGMQAAAGLAGGSAAFAPEMMRAITSSRPIEALAQEVSTRLKQPADYALGKITQYAERHNLTIPQLVEKLRASPGHMLGDIFPQELRDVVSKPGKSRTLAENAIADRMPATRAHVQGATMDSLGVDTANVYGEHQALNEQMRNIAKTRGYDDILNAGHVEFTPKLETLMKRNPFMKDALKFSKRMMEHDISIGRPGVDSSMEQFFKEDPHGGVEFIPTNEKENLIIQGSRPRVGKHTFDINAWKSADLKPAPDLPGYQGEISGDVANRPTLRAWDYVKRGLQAYIEDQRGDFGKLSTSGKYAQEALSELMGELNKNKDYASLLAEYADPKRGQDLLKAGRTFMRRDAEEIASEMANLTPAEKRYYRVGVTRDLMEENPLQAYRNLNRKGGTFNQAYYDKVRSVYEPGQQGQAEMDKFVDALRVKAEQQHTGNTALNPSATGSILAGQKDLERGANQVKTGMVTGRWERVVEGLSNMLDSEKSELRRNEIGRILTMAEGGERDKVLRAVEGLFNTGPRATRIPMPSRGKLPAAANAYAQGQSRE